MGGRRIRRKLRLTACEAVRNPAEEALSASSFVLSPRGLDIVTGLRALPYAAGPSHEPVSPSAGLRKLVHSVGMKRPSESGRSG